MLPRPGHLRATRLRFGLSQFQVATLAGCRHQADVSHAELGAGPHRERIMRALMRCWEEKRAERWMSNHRRLQLAEDNARIASQEALWAALPDSPQKEALLDAMIDRCFDLMCDGQGAECDAIAEWLPRDRVLAMFAAWEQWFDGGDDATRDFGEPVRGECVDQMAEPPLCSAVPAG